MTDDSEKADRAVFESDNSAHDGDLADSLAVDSAVDEDDEAAPGPATARVPRHPPGRPNPDVDQDRVSALGEDTAVIPTYPPPQPEGPVERGPDGAAAAVQPPSAAGPQRRTRRERRGKRKAPWWELPLLVAIAILVAVLVKTFVIQPFYIPSDSMEKTLHGCPTCQGDRILVNKPIFDLRDPHPGDIVVFHAPPGWDDEPPSLPPANPVLRVMRGFGQLVGFVPPDGLVLVKRVIATGGQTVKGLSVAGRDRIMVSDTGPGGPFRTLSEPYTYYNADDSRAVFGPVTVPKGRVWVMGDHRNDSADSRFHCGSQDAQGTVDGGCDPTTSTVPIDDVIGKAVVIAWPPSRWRTLGTPSTFKNAALALRGDLPAAAAAAFAVPLYLARRRRRRR